MKDSVKAPCTPNPVVLTSRPSARITCPHCWTDQQASRDRCWHCGAQFIFQDEVQREDDIARQAADAACGKSA